ncbi:cyclic GMP-AMP synthase-like receptor isoform X2 [Periplaneta americana]|uniref:cyclic GMP-AMP synthase-like receptor isoform X2 n=1 Tax=Periplaneta americana TaxID=6978 RepID=UPI0037E8224E
MDMNIPANVTRMEPFFQNLISQEITLQEDEVKLANHRLKNVLLELTERKMKTIDETFQELYCQPIFVGSYYENLRVGHPNEFDINLELRLPISNSNIMIETSKTEPGFAKIKVNKKFHPHVSQAVINKIESWLDDGYMCKDKILQWLQGIVDKVIRNMEWPDDMTVTRSMSGPAVTLNVTYNDKEFSVDFVPVFTFGCDKWPSQPLRQLRRIPRTFRTDNLKWCVVPKAPRNRTSSTHEWRMSFYTFEVQIMKDLGNMKPVIKIMKLLRDKQNWVNLSSYYIKTLFMLEQERMKNEPNFWRRSISYLFMHMLGRLVQCLHEGKIDFFWDHRSNLIAHLRPEEIINMHGAVKRLRTRLVNALALTDVDLREELERLFTPPSCNPRNRRRRRHIGCGFHR